ncbi:hypothetical protein ACFOTA_18910 [Chitinophaga sp. GCM10012297]|uniref:GOLD domain-containing protein n=1 Tax=Chitinophaga chungangae TaxID=2821488 RepID=A0ABS3YI30_9BACT|nr:hypothetical protein [Chitinophaga chungangae]MBO9154294.1 hypothetical protein [Chitinophaga chungangae]
MKLYLAAVIMLSAITSCHKDDPAESKYERKFSPVVSTELQNAGAAGLTVSLKVTFQVYNGCGQFDSFVVSSDKDTGVVKVLARYPKEAFCTQDIPQRTATFKKTFPAPGTYYIKWVGPAQSGPETVTHRDTITVK